jgi:spore photoproduct lyase
MGRNWVDPSVHLKRIFIESSCEDLDYTKEIIDRAALPVTVVEDRDRVSIVGGHYPANLTEGKRSLLLCRNEGEFVKDCPGTREYRCCGYRIINTGSGCPMDCVYCILQASLNTPYLSFFVNIEDLFAELVRKMAAYDGPVMRIGTGEFTDSMALDRITGLSRRLVEFFGGQDKGVLELKTKSAYVDNLCDLDHNGRTIVAWSLNGQAIARGQEIRAAPLDQRLTAARKCVDWGYSLAFHFDPIIVYPGWESEYQNVIDKLFAVVPSERIKWISLGALRYIPSLKQIATSRFPHATIFDHEFIESMDGKKRYFRTLRVEMYKLLYDLLRRRCEERTCIYFCMESDEIWREVTGFEPAERGGISAMLDDAVTAS